MSKKIIFSLVPRLPPAIDGLGDYGLILARQLRLDHDVETHFIVADPKWSGEDSIEGFPVSRIGPFKRDLPKSLINRPSAVLLVHYVGYGYARRGCPTWLLRSLKKWKSKNTQNRLITMFHELYAFGPIWSSQFWTSPLQRKLARDLALLSDHLLTSKKIYADILKKYTGGKYSEIPVLPVFSNVGEISSPLLLKERKKRMIIFGSKVPRSRAYLRSHAELESIVRKYNIEEICDIGAFLDFELPLISGMKIRQMGLLKDSEISELMASSFIGFINYPTEYLAKSGIFAAYCAHGMLIIAAAYKDQRTDAVIENTHYLRSDLNSDSSSIESFQRVADNAYDWYKAHGQSVHANAFSRFF